MSDRYLNIVNSPVGSAVASRVGLPRPVRLRRYSAGDPLLPGPALLGSTGGKPAPALRKLLVAAGADVLDKIGPEDRVAAVVLDARSVAVPTDLGAVRDAIADALTPHQRAVLVAVTLNDVPIDVLAERLATTRGALYKTLHDARKSLRARLAEQGLEGATA